MNKHQRSWLAFANSKVCKHANAIHDKGFINWGMKNNFHFLVGDIIYLFVSNSTLKRLKFFNRNDKTMKITNQSNTLL